MTDPVASDAAALRAARAAVRAAAATLSAAGARSEVLAEYQPARRVLGIPRAARMREIARVWRLGVLLVDADARLYAVGRVVRAEAPARRSIIANSVAEQRALRAAAVTGGIAAGETVDFDAVELPLGAGPAPSDPLVVRDGQVLVRWSPAQPDALIPLTAYLADRVALLVDPPGGG